MLFQILFHRRVLFFGLVSPSGDTGGDRCPVSNFSLLTRSTRKCSVSLARYQERWRLHSLEITEPREKSLENRHKCGALHFCPTMVSAWRKKKKGRGGIVICTVYFFISLESFSPAVSGCT